MHGALLLVMRFDAKPLYFFGDFDVCIISLQIKVSAKLWL